jgi:hypothetical protein
MMRTLGLAPLALLLVACGGGIPHIIAGRPAFEAGSPESYWVWHDEAGWHLRTTTARKPHHFHGWVEPVGGIITDLHATRTEWGDRIRLVPRGIEFDFETDGGEDGFDWRVSSGCNRFDLRVDGAERPGLVHVGAEGHHPDHIPFARCR